MTVAGDDAALIAELRRDEAVRPKPYTDTKGKTTIGVGRNLTDNGLSDDEISYLLRNDIARVNAELNTHVPWWKGLDPVRRRVLQNMVFNLGWPRLSGFKNTLAAIQTGRWSTAAAEMLDSDWARQTGDRATRLARMMRTGEAP